ncbi:unnamed protein product [Brassica napus]|uniref:(rape) hypothetical protein n=1 Tax=Brassica napus TaxID=3708 RepID=A0A816JGS5_BRANA|nr:unnamed protein product [Brassica napus]
MAESPVDAAAVNTDTMRLELEKTMTDILDDGGSQVHTVQSDPHRSGPKLAHRFLSEHYEDVQRAIISRGHIRHKLSHIDSWNGS